MPTDEDIFNLKNGTMSSTAFDAKYGAGKAELYLKTQEEEKVVPVEKEPESRITEIPEQLAGGILQGTQELAKSIGGLSEIAEDKFNLEDLSATIRENALE